MGRRKYVQWLFILSLLSCAKEKPALPPVIEFVKPSENAVFQIGDTIDVLAEVHSGLPLNRISLSLLTQSGLPVQHMEDLLPGMVSGRVQASYPLYDSSLETGTYQLRILAEHESDNKKKYRTIQIEGIPREWKGLIAVTRQNFDRNRIVWIHGDMSHTDLDTIQGDHLASLLHQHSGTLFHLGRIYGGVTAYHLKSRQVVWSVPPSPNPPFPTYTQMMIETDKVFVGLHEGRIRVFHVDGQEKAGLYLTASRIPGSMGFYQDRLFVDEKARAGSERFLGVYHYPSGMMSQTYTPGIETVGLFPISFTEMFWVGNVNNQGVIRIYKPLEGGYWAPLDLPSGKLKFACTGPNGHLLLSTSLGILWYRRDLNSLSVLQSSISPHWLDYDDLTSHICAAKGSQLYLIAFPSGQISAQKELNDSIFEAHHYYNR